MRRLRAAHLRQLGVLSLVRSLAIAMAICAATAARAADLSADERALQGMEPVMVDVSHRQPPSEAEWEALAEDGQRGIFGSLCDFRSKTIAFMNTRYFTANPTDGTLASFGKMGADKRFDRFGHIHGVQYSLDQNSWKQRHVLNAAALFKLAGSRFIEFAGVGVAAAVESNKQIEVTFIGTTVPKDVAIRSLNADIEALEYLNEVEKQRAEQAGQGKLFGGGTPPAARIVLSNVVMLDGRFSKALDTSADGKLHSRIIGDAVELKVAHKNGEEITLLSPVVRCYRTYSMQFKQDRDKKPLRVELRDAAGRVHNVPQVFDLTPDI